MTPRASLLHSTLKWVPTAAAVGILVGGACALFLHSLDRVTALRMAHPWLVWCLPAAGAGVALIYRFTCKQSEKGNNLIIEEIHRPECGVPLRMAPLVLGATLVSHLFGASVGREGTAIQMGGAIAGGLGRRLKGFLKPEDLPTLLMCGVAAGFGGVFGTPVAGAVFAAEVLTRGHLRYLALGPCLIAAFAADFTALRWGAVHVDYGALLAGALDRAPVSPLSLFLQAALAAACFGLAAALFIRMTHGAKSLFNRLVPVAWLRPAAGGTCVVLLSLACGTQAYLGLGVDSIHPADTTLITCFFAGGVVASAWLWKLLFTAVSVGSGLKGGEVTPLFFIGAALGHTLPEAFSALAEIPLKAHARWIAHLPQAQVDRIHVTPAPAELFAALGFAAVFAGAANAPLACTIMGMEIFGAHHAPLFALACFGAFAVSGKSSLYAAQKNSPLAA